MPQRPVATLLALLTLGCREVEKPLFTVPERVGLNLLMVLTPLYAIQGLAVLRHFFQKARLPRHLQGVGFGLFLLQPLLLIFAACLGLSDLWADFRKIRRAATPA